MEHLIHCLQCCCVYSHWKRDCMSTWKIRRSYQRNQTSPSFRRTLSRSQPSRCSLIQLLIQFSFLPSKTRSNRSHRLVASLDISKAGGLVARNRILSILTQSLLGADAKFHCAYFGACSNGSHHLQLKTSSSAHGIFCCHYKAITDGTNQCWGHGLASPVCRQMVRGLKAMSASCIKSTCAKCQHFLDSTLHLPLRVQCNEMFRPLTNVLANHRAPHLQRNQCHYFYRLLADAWDV